VSTQSVIEQKEPIKSCLRFNKFIVLDPLSSPAESPKRVLKGCFKLPMSANDLDWMPTAGDNAFTDDKVVWCKETIWFLWAYSTIRPNVRNLRRNIMLMEPWTSCWLAGCNDLARLPVRLHQLG
jgi:hypothetical protein